MYNEHKKFLDQIIEEKFRKEVLFTKELIERADYSIRRREELGKGMNIPVPNSEDLHVPDDCRVIEM
jgi:hypothetical protein